VGPLHCGSIVRARRPGTVLAALNDPTLEVLLPAGPARWLDREGRRKSRLPAAPGREVTVIHDDQGTSAVALVHDQSLRGDEDLLSAISALVIGMVRHHDVTDKLGATLQQLEQSRRRIAEAAASERARIERASMTARSSG
jgi:hypothetical protein